MSTARDLLNRIDHPGLVNDPTVDPALVRRVLRYLLARQNEREGCIPAREAEREATQPSAGDGDGDGDERTLDQVDAQTRTLLGAMFGPRPTPPPAPVDEAAVEALARALDDHCPVPGNEDRCICGHTYGDTETVDQHTASILRAALERGAVPGYGPTGASVGAGEVVVSRYHLRRVLDRSDDLRASSECALSAALDTP